MKLIIGIGNPGEKYQNSRHNVGHLFATYLQDKKTNVSDDLVAKKSDVFMNDSGHFVKKLVDQYGINTPELWVIHDDLDIPLGSYKIQFGRGPKAHNGILSIESELGEDDFWRVRIGVDNRSPESRESGEEYVLKDFTHDELLTLQNTFPKILKELLTKLENE